jgi:ribosomal-protein-alanine N-acetyltransferase
MKIILPGLTIRDWEVEDAPTLAENANDRRIWRNLRDRFPHPYGLVDAEAFIAMTRAMEPRTFFAMVVDGRLAGSIGFTLHDDVERVSAEIGYYVAVPYWGKGIATAALIAVTNYAFKTHPDLRRIFAVPFAWSTASARVLEKAGYRLEGRMRQSAIKDGEVTDQLLYAILRDEAAMMYPEGARQ